MDHRRRGDQFQQTARTSQKARSPTRSRPSRPYTARWVNGSHEECVTGGDDECWGFSRQLYASATAWVKAKSDEPFPDMPDDLKNENAFGRWLKSKQYTKSDKRVEIFGRTGTVPKSVFRGIGLKSNPQPAFVPKETS